jgi:YHS domain-containing protein
VTCNIRWNGSVFAILPLLKTISLAGANPMTSDPVCGTKIDEITAEFQTQFAGKKYFFCSEECRTEFEDRPDEFLPAAA